MKGSNLLILSLINLSNAQAPGGTSICDYYSAKQNAVNATESQRLFIEGFVANVFGGNSSVFTGTSVPGVLSAGTFNGQEIRLAKYFDGTRYSTQSKQGQPQAVNWMDDGGAITLAGGKIANSNTSNQYKLLSRFASLFARVMQCTSLIASNYTSNLGQQQPNLYQVHKFMALDPNELGYFIEQVGLAAKTVGISETEANTITTNMGRSLNLRCRAPVAVVPGGPVGPQGICTDEKCELAPNPDCSAYDYPNGISPEPALVNGAVPSASATPSSTATPKKKSNVLPIAVGVAVPVGLLILALIAWLIIRSRKKVTALEDRLSRVEGTSTPYGVTSDKASFNVAQSEATPTIASARLARESNATASGSFYDPNTSTYMHHSPDPRPFSGEPFGGAGGHQSYQSQGHSPYEAHNTSPQPSNPPVRSASGAVPLRPGQPPQEMA